MRFTVKSFILLIIFFGMLSVQNPTILASTENSLDSEQFISSAKEKQEKTNKSDDKKKEQKQEIEKKHECGPYCTHSGKKPPVIPGAKERTIKLDYRLHVSNIPQNAKKAYAWIPLPRSNDYQTLIDYKVSGNWKYEIVKDAIYGNKFILVDLKSVANKKSPEAQVMVKYELKRTCGQPIAKCRIRQDYKQSEMERYLRPDSLVPLNDLIINNAKRITGDQSGFSIQARLIFDDIVATVKYDDSGFDLTHGDAVRTLQNKSGNSADLNSLFVGETRSLSIPSRLVAGVTIPIGNKGEISVYHTWSEFFDPDFGWLPVDIGKAIKDKEYRESYFGGLDANRLEFSVGRDILLPKSSAGPLNIAIYPHVEIDGKVHKDIKYSISYQEVPGKGAVKKK